MLLMCISLWNRNIQYLVIRLHNWIFQLFKVWDVLLSVCLIYGSHACVLWLNSIQKVFAWSFVFEHCLVIFKGLVSSHLRFILEPKFRCPCCGLVSGHSIHHIWRSHTQWSFSEISFHLVAFFHQKWLVALHIGTLCSHFITNLRWIDWIFLLF